MNEQIRIRLISNGAPLTVALSAEGIVLRGESSSAPRRVALEFQASGAPTQMRVRNVQQRMGWSSSTLPLKVTGTADGLILAGDEPDTLPEGIYECRLRIDDLRLAEHGQFRAEVEKNATTEVVLNAIDDPRQIRLTRAVEDLHPGLRRLLTASGSTLDGMGAAEWLTSMVSRPSRKACLLNVLAKVASDPAPLLDTVNALFFADVDRIYTEVTPQCGVLLQQLVDDPRRPFMSAGAPKAEVHFRMLDRANVSRDDYTLRSFRQQGSNCLQVVVGSPLAGRGDRHFAEFDIDLGNPLQDVAGFVVHLGELLNPGRTDHFSLREKLLSTAAGAFLGYDIVEPHVDVRILGT